MHNFYIFGLCVLSAITSSFGDKSITSITNSNPAVSSSPTPQPTPANRGEPLNRREAGTPPLRSNGTGPLFPREVFRDIGWRDATVLSERITKREIDEDLEKREPYELVQIPNIQVPPFNNVGFVGAKNKDLCIGTLVGPYHVLVPAHCIHPGGVSKDFFQDIFFTFPYKTGSSRSGRPKSRFESANAVVHDLWKTSGDFNYDLGLIVLRDCPLPVRRMDFNWSPNIQPGMFMSMITNPAYEKTLTILLHTLGEIIHVEAEAFVFHVIASLDGSPVYKGSDAGGTIYGMVLFNRWGPKDRVFDFQVVRITQEKYDLIKLWIEDSYDENSCRPQSQ